MPDGYFVQSTEQRVPIAEYLSACVDVEKFIGYCRACRNYGRRWSRPSFDFDPLDLWKRYQAIHIHARVLTPVRGADMVVMMEGLKREKEKLTDALLKNGAGYAGQPCPLSRQLFPLRQLYPAGGNPLPGAGADALFHRSAGRGPLRNDGAVFPAAHPLEQEREKCRTI